LARDASRSGGALVTGGARGLGFEIARMLVARGFSVHVTDLDGDAAARAAQSLGPNAWASALDVRDEDACHAAAASTAEHAGSLALWVNNAGVLVTGPAWEQDVATRRLMLDVNAVGTINGTLAALRVMRPTGTGHVVNIVSLAGIVAAPGEAVYSASKHAAIAFSIATLADLRLAGVRSIDISCICPDGIWTPMLHDKLEDPTAAASFTGVLLMPEYVAARVADVLDHPRPVTTIPRWRGALMRVFDGWPRLAIRGIGPVIASGRLQQRRLARKVQRGTWPPA
jgi:NAD(P)-dependent dehydrogenase (short-subunit alcohol dehydrogenase family)